MERIEEERTFKNTYYKAWDGTIFHDEKRCIEYESKPSIIAWKNVQSFLVRKCKQWRLSVSYSEDEHEAFVFKPTCHEDIDALNTFISIDRWETVRKNKQIDDSYIGKDIFVFGEYSWEVFTLEEMVDEFRNYLNYIIDSDETDIDYDDDEEKIIRNSMR